jgi:hypothetical protein
MILDAKSTDEIASAFNLSRKTVANYHYAIKSKLGVDSDIELLSISVFGKVWSSPFPQQWIPGNRSQHPNKSSGSFAILAAIRSTAV